MKSKSKASDRMVNVVVRTIGVSKVDNLRVASLKFGNRSDQQVKVAVVFKLQRQSS